MTSIAAPYLSLALQRRRLYRMPLRLPHSPEARLRELGIELPKVTAPVANYVLSARLGNIIFLAGAGPLNPDGSRPQGKVGRDVTLEQANQHARNAGLQLLAALRDAAGSLDKVVRFGRGRGPWLQRPVIGSGATSCQ